MAKQAQTPRSRSRNAPKVEATPVPLSSIGERLRQARTGRFSINELSRVSGVSSGRISEIERGSANPSFETLWRLATALEIPIGAFFGGPEPETTMLVRSNARKRLALPHDDLEYELLTPDLQRMLEVFLFHVPPDFDNSARPISHKGEECIHLLDGSLVVHVGDREFELESGDTVTYEASIPHYVANRSTRTAHAMAIVTPPSF